MEVQGDSRATREVPRFRSVFEASDGANQNVPIICREREGPWVTGVEGNDGVLEVGWNDSASGGPSCDGDPELTMIALSCSFFLATTQPPAS